MGWRVRVVRQAGRCQAARCRFDSLPRAGQRPGTGASTAAATGRGEGEGVPGAGSHDACRGLNLAAAHAPYSSCLPALRWLQQAPCGLVRRAFGAERKERGAGLPAYNCQVKAGAGTAVAAAAGSAEGSRLIWCSPLQHTRHMSPCSADTCSSQHTAKQQQYAHPLGGCLDVGGLGSHRTRPSCRRRRCSRRCWRRPLRTWRLRRCPRAPGRR